MIEPRCCSTLLNLHMMGIYCKPAPSSCAEDLISRRSEVQKLSRVSLSEFHEASVASLRSAFLAKCCSSDTVRLREEGSPACRLSKDQVNQLRGEPKQVIELPCSDCFVQEFSHRFDDGISSQGGLPTLHQAASRCEPKRGQSMPHMQVQEAVAAEARRRGIQEVFKSVSVCRTCPPSPLVSREKEDRRRAWAAGRDNHSPKPEPGKQEIEGECLGSSHVWRDVPAHCQAPLSVDWCQCFSAVGPQP